MEKFGGNGNDLNTRANNVPNVSKLITKKKKLYGYSTKKDEVKKGLIAV